MAQHAHSAIVFHHNQRWIQLETSPRRGANLQSLVSIIEQYPGKIDVFRLERWAATQVDHAEFKRLSLSFVGMRYGWWTLTRIAAMNVPGIWNMVPMTSTEKAENNIIPTCSQMLSHCFLASGLDIVPRTQDWKVVPGDLTKSLAFKYEGVLTSSEMSRKLNSP